MYKPIAGYESAFGLNPAGGGAVSSLMTDLVAYWRMEETGTVDRVDAISSLALHSVGTVTATTGKKNNGVDLEWDGGYKHLYDTTHTKYSIPLTGKTWAMWMRKYSSSGGTHLMFKGDNAGLDEYDFYISAAGKPTFYLIGGDGSWSDYVQVGGSDGDISGTELQLIIGWADPADWKIRYSINNGTTKASAAGLAGTPYNGSQDFSINLQPPSTPLFGAIWDEFMMWDRPLTSDERTELHNSGTGKFLNAGGTDFE
jgi:hypothetical protein